MRVVNGSLMVCLAYSNRKTKCQNYRKISQIEKCKNELFKMS